MLRKACCFLKCFIQRGSIFLQRFIVDHQQQLTRLTGAKDVPSQANPEHQNDLFVRNFYSVKYQNLYLLFKYLCKTVLAAYA